MEDKFINKVKNVISRKPLNAETAYTLSVYGQRMSKDNVYQKSISDIESRIELRSQNKGTSILYEYDNNFPTMGEDIMKYFKDLGYIVLMIDSSTFKEIKNPKLLISWER